MSLLDLQHPEYSVVIPFPYTNIVSIQNCITRRELCMILRNGKLKVHLHFPILQTMHSKFQKCNPLVNYNIQTNTSVCLAILRGREQPMPELPFLTAILSHPKQLPLRWRQISFDPSWCCYFEALITTVL